MEYRYQQGKLGVEIRGIDLKGHISEETIQKLRNDVHVYKLLIFKNQDVVSGQRHVEISKWFGELESTFYKHGKSPHPQIFRVSNEETEGCRGVGRTGWHIDGSFMKQPFRYAIYHMVSVPQEGSTAFISLNDLIKRLSNSKTDKWESLWMVSNGHYDVIHPLIYPHPSTGMDTMCFHLGMMAEIVSDFEKSVERVWSYKETQELLDDILYEIKKNSDLIYTHKFFGSNPTTRHFPLLAPQPTLPARDNHHGLPWEVGDFIISDNLAVAHEATPETQIPASVVGLRVLHRTTIKGENSPHKI